MPIWRRIHALAVLSLDLDPLQEPIIDLPTLRTADLQAHQVEDKRQVRRMLRERVPGEPGIHF